MGLQKTQAGLTRGDLADNMMACWADPFATEHDPRHMLALGAEEIRRLRKLTHTMDEMLAGMYPKRKPEPPFVLFVLALALIAGVMMLMWALVRPVL
jgi:hypothetical protein